MNRNCFPTAEDGVCQITGADVLPGDYDILYNIISRRRRRQGLPKHPKTAMQDLSIELLLEIAKANSPNLSGFNSRRAQSLLATLNVSLDCLSDGADYVALEVHLRSKGFLRP